MVAGLLHITSGWLITGGKVTKLVQRTYEKRASYRHHRSGFNNIFVRSTDMVTSVFILDSFQLYFEELKTTPKPRKLVKQV